MKNTTGVILFTGISLLAGFLIYAITRDESVYLNMGLISVADGSLLRFLQGLVPNASLPHWMIYSLPNGLWMLGFVMILLLIWDFRINRKSIPWIAACVLTGILFEILQVPGIVHGTFDITDLMFLLIAAFIPISLILCKPYLCAIK